MFLKVWVILLSFVLLSSFSYAFAEVTPSAESEFVASYAQLSTEDQMIFREQAVACDDWFDSVAAEPPITRPQVYQKLRLCLIENLDVNKSFLMILEQNEELKEQNKILLLQNSGLINQTGQLSDKIVEISDASIIQSQESAKNTFLAMIAGAAVTLVATFGGIKILKKK